MCSLSLLKEVSSNLQPFLTNRSYHLLLACSGGADSTALLLLIYQLQSSFSYSISVITVNHNIRESLESAHDAHFVFNLCKSLAVPCYIAELPVHAVDRCAAQRKRGIEDAARFLRYAAFEKQAAAIHADFILTAHNQNDVYETILMRLFQGAGSGTLKKMPFKRDMYLRPLITVDRLRLESFLKEQGVTWCEDSTNVYNTYLRNRIRHFLVPALTQTFGSWHLGLDKTLTKIHADASFCDALLEQEQAAYLSRPENACVFASAVWRLCKTKGLSLSSVFFYSLAMPLRLRLLEKACNQLNMQERVPSGILLRMAAMEPKEKIINAGNVLLEHRNAALFFFNKRVYHALYQQRGYCIEVHNYGRYPYPLGVLFVYKKDDACFCKDSDDAGDGIGPLQLPFFVRGRRAGDRIRMKNGLLKTVKKIFNEWALDSLARELLPIIIENNSVRALYGSPLGYQDWIVKMEAMYADSAYKSEDK